MALNPTQLRADFAFMVADLPTTITYQGASYSAVVGDLSSEEQLDEAGVIDGADFEVFINTDDFSTLPGVNALITISGEDYRVQSVSDAPDGVTRKLLCIGETEQ